MSGAAGLALPPLESIAVVGAHCDDLAIGAGATLLRLATANPGLRVHALVCTGDGTERAAEERAALGDLLPGAELDLRVLHLPDGRLPDHAGEVKDHLQALAAAVPDAGLVLAPHRHDAHQDHRLLGEMVPTSFRSQLHLGYEIVKWESDLPATNLYQPVDETTAARKVAVITERYASQRHHDWFDDEAFLGLMRIRGVQCHRRYAEAFVVEKLLLAD